MSESQVTFYISIQVITVIQQANHSLISEFDAYFLQEPRRAGHKIRDVVGFCSFMLGNVIHTFSSEYQVSHEKPS